MKGKIEFFVFETIAVLFLIVTITCTVKRDGMSGFIFLVLAWASMDAGFSIKEKAEKEGEI